MLLRNLAIATSLVVGAPAAAFATPHSAAVVETVNVKAPAPSASDAASYAEREKQDEKTPSFQGGDMVVVGISGGAIIVLLFLLLVLA